MSDQLRRRKRRTKPETCGHRRLSAIQASHEKDYLPKTCSVPGCGRATMLASGRGIAAFHCRRHVEHKARHGSHWCPTYRAADLKPYIKAAERGRKANPTGPGVVFAIQTLGHVPIKGIPFLRRVRFSFGDQRRV